MIRIGSGRLKGRRLVHSTYEQIRPTTSLVREAMFNTIGAERLQKASFLDLFAGTGVVGFEAFSRGASSVGFVESNKQLSDVLRRHKNLFDVEGFLLGQPYELALKRLGRQEQSFDIIFMDPPYDFCDYESTLHLIAEKKLLRPGGLLVVERSSNSPRPQKSALQIIRERPYGKTMLDFYRH